VLPTSLCERWIKNGPPSPADFRALVAGPLDRLEQAAGLVFGDARKPLLVSVRSGAPVSMPGMLDTVLNIGLTRSTLPGLVALTGNPRLAWDCYLRLIASYAQTVQGLDLRPFEKLSANAAAVAGSQDIAGLDTLALRDLVLRHLELFSDLAGEPFPDDPFQQLVRAVDAVFRSWNAEKAKCYRRINRLEGLPGTAVTVQRMVFGNAGPRSGAGVGFTRDPATGEKGLYLDFAFDAQGEDVVSGRRPLTRATELARLLPEVMVTLDQAGTRLEQAFRDAQDFEFTVEEGQLFMLQTRDAKRSAWARLKIAVDLVQEHLISPNEALLRLKGLDLAAIVRRHVVSSGGAIAKGIPAGIGVASGTVAMTVAQANALAAQGKTVILVRTDITTDDIDGIACAAGVLTARGGRTSHAAVVARELGKVAIVGCGALRVADDDGSCTIAGLHFDQGAEITLDGETGQIYAGTVAIEEERPLQQLAAIDGWSRNSAVESQSGVSPTLAQGL
jgi:pyruvate,orthophosphate dikinase